MIVMLTQERNVKWVVHRVDGVLYEAISQGFRFRRAKLEMSDAILGESY